MDCFQTHRGRGGPGRCSSPLLVRLSSPQTPKPAACMRLDTGCPPDPAGPAPHWCRARVESQEDRHPAATPEGQGPRLAAQMPPLWAPEALLPPDTNTGVHGHAIQPKSLLSEPSRHTTPSFQNSPRTKLILPLLGHVSEKSFHKASVTVIKQEKVTPAKGAAPTGGDTPGPVTGWSWPSTCPGLPVTSPGTRPNRGQAPSTPARGSSALVQGPRAPRSRRRGAGRRGAGRRGGGQRRTPTRPSSWDPHAQQFLA